MKAQVEQIHVSPRQSFICRRFEETVFDHPFHFHPEIELTFIERSRGSLAVGDYLGEFGEGDLFLLGPNLPHIFQNTVEPANGAASEVLHFSREIAQGFIDGTPEMEALSELLDRAALGLRFSPEVSAQAGAQLREMRQSAGIDRWVRFLDLMRSLCNASDARSLCNPGYTLSFAPGGNDRLRRACQIIFEHFDEDLSHEDLANQLSITPAYLSRLFKKTTRRTFTEFLTEVRLGHACRLLTDTEQPVVEVAFNSGFRNLSNFNRRFKKAYGCSPRHYRKQHLGHPS